MKEQLEQRLALLKSEFDSGQNMLNDLEIKKDELNQTMLRISGAIQVLEEMVAHSDNSAKDEVLLKESKPLPMAEVA